MVTWIIIFIQTFLLSNTMNFYLLDGIANKALENSNYQMTENEVKCFQTLKIASMVSLLGMFVTSFISFFIR